MRSTSVRTQSEGPYRYIKDVFYDSNNNVVRQYETCGQRIRRQTGFHAQAAILPLRLELRLLCQPIYL